MAENTDIAAVLGGTVEAITAGLGALPDDALLALHEAEEKGDKRTTLLAAIDHETKRRSEAREIKFSQNDMDAAIADALANQPGAAEAAAERQKAIDAVLADAKDIAAHRDKLQQELQDERTAHAETKAQLATASKAAAVTPGEKPAEPRAAGPIKKGLFGDDLAKALADKPHQVVFSDGSMEVPALDPIDVAGPAWSITGRGAVLITPVSVKPERRVTIAGFALFDGDKQVAWSPLNAPIVIAANQETKLDRQIVF